MTSSMNAVSAQSLTKYYGSFKAVDDIDFEVKRGERFGFLGPNGAGKTTVMSILYCFFPPTSGEVEIFGKNVVKEPSRIKACEGVMPQDDNLDPDFSALENLTVYARYFDIPKSRSLPRARELLDFVGIAEKTDVNIRQLSGGMRRRLLLARALINEPELLILDEPTTGMDPHGRREVWRNLDDLKSHGTTIILSTHYMEEAESICDRVAIMDLGRIVTMDSPRRLMEAHGCANLEDVYLKLTGRALHEA